MVIYADFQSENNKQMVSHIREEHEDGYCCYLCDKYFETKQSLKYDEFIHNQQYTLTDSEGEDAPKINSNEVNQKH